MQLDKEVTCKYILPYSETGRAPDGSTYYIEGEYIIISGTHYDKDIMECYEYVEGDAIK